jgi:UDP-N-acetylglucosamine 1-carboxyvinyltransferase
MPATLLSDEPLTLTNAPRLSDIRTMTILLQSLGAEVSSCRTAGCWRCRRMI